LLDAANEHKNYQQTNFDINNTANHSRNSLPDITTPKEEKQERNYSSLSRPNQVKRSHSNENILNEAPPLPPKKQIQLPAKDLVDGSGNFLFDEDEVDERQSFLKPQSPDKNSSIGSVSSMLNDLSFDLKASINERSAERKLSTSSPIQRNSNESFASQSSILRIKHQQNISHIAFQQDFGTFENLSMQSFKSEESSSSSRVTVGEVAPPPLPVGCINSSSSSINGTNGHSQLQVKTKRWEHHKSMYDNVEMMTESNSAMIVTTSSSSSSLASSVAVSSTTANMLDFGETFLMKKHRTICIDTRKPDDAEKKPPLPPKQKKHSKFLFPFRTTS
jgi:hypothetical protein